MKKLMILCAVTTSFGLLGCPDKDAATADPSASAKPAAATPAAAAKPAASAAPKASGGW